MPNYSIGKTILTNDRLCLMKLGARIKEKRKAAGLTQRQVADYFGIKPPSVSEWESGSSAPDIAKLQALARLLKTSVSYIVSGKDDPQEQASASAALEYAPDSVKAAANDTGITADEVFTLLENIRIASPSDRAMILKSAQLAGDRARRADGVLAAGHQA